MRIGLIDVDGHNYPNLPLMKLSAWHKQLGHSVSWHETGKQYDRVYMSKVFSFTNDYEGDIHADEVVRGGSGYAIRLRYGGHKEWYDETMDADLPPGIEHILPDYSLYGLRDTAYGFLTRGCPRGCGFCHVGAKEGRRCRKVADLREFWTYQNNIVLMDPNLLACPEHMDLLRQLAESGAKVDINQGLDARLLTEENIAALKDVRLSNIHFAYDRMTDSAVIEKNLRWFKSITGFDKNKGKVTCYILVNYDTSIEEDIKRIMFCRELKFTPYPMIYNKQNAPKVYRQMQRWCSNYVFWKVPTFEEYLHGSKKD